MSNTASNIRKWATAFIATVGATKADLVNGTVPANQLPSYVDDVLEVANYAALPVEGAADVIYITIDTGNSYRWTGSVYVNFAVDDALSKSTGGTVTAGSVTTGDAGYQIVNYGGTCIADDPIGLALWANGYGFRIAVDGGAVQNILVTGLSHLSTYAELLTAINGLMSGATVAIDTGDLRFTSSTFGAASSIALTDDIGGAEEPLLASLAGYTAINAAVVGVDGVDVAGVLFDHHIVVQGEPVTAELLAKVGSVASVRYANVAAIDFTPVEGDVVMFTGQGLASYKSGAWTLCSDDTTAAT